MPSSTSSEYRMPTLEEENCVICGDLVKSNRLGAPACWSCMIFFRRGVIRKSGFVCPRNKDCCVVNELRVSCRHCRFQKCLQSGMKPSFVVTRDTLEPRTPPPSIIDIPKNLVEPLVKLQDSLLEDHQKQMIHPFRRATVADVNQMFKWSFNDSIKWASNFEPFLRLTNEQQKCVISEFGFAFFIIDQGFENAKHWRKRCWILQNGTLLYSDYFKELEDSRGILEFDPDLIRSHSEFVEYLETSIKRQFQILQIDKFEVAVLKTLLLFSSSFPKRHIFTDFQEKTDAYKNKCLEELMEYLSEKYPTSCEMRFGKLILFMGDIRNAIKVVYNHTKISDLFDSRKFDMFVRSFFLS
ncbi:Protein CBR-NHR-270 [Caenorhabditis briggsae]|uniref:Uncharacterized protein n=2 Tax=Caenorhabditis briggsae TaxID=6238 RepID=A0AAE8ZX10_CAEBR|nr:Protein CBR-NHR-270 [Caenorhabditis briggsae]ULT86821.1 hypothetical protein L3Y34_006504 [Caenorhabditis briggsae]CAP38562.1 Protein CBR-NHR-270 [Caenorhabditis briggsae]